MVPRDETAEPQRRINALIYGDNGRPSRTEAWERKSHLIRRIFAPLAHSDADSLLGLRHSLLQPYTTSFSIPLSDARPRERILPSTRADVDEGVDATGSVCRYRIIGAARTTLPWCPAAGRAKLCNSCKRCLAARKVHLLPAVLILRVLPFITSTLRTSATCGSHMHRSAVKRAAKTVCHDQDKIVLADVQPKRKKTGQRVDGSH